MTVYGYARVSTDWQSLASQDAQLHAAGCAKVYSEKVSGARSDRAELAKLLRRLGDGDVLVRSSATPSLGGASFNHDSAMRSQTALSIGVIALSDCCRHSSALSRNSSAVL
jgi:hypothetical protein